MTLTPQRKWFILFVVSLIFQIKLYSQRLVVDTSSSPAFANAVTLYNQSFASQLHLFNGKEYEDYHYQFDEGQPYFLSDKVGKGSVSYDGNNYEDVSMLYNAVSDELIIANYRNISKIQLLKEKVDSFSLYGHAFVNIGKSSAAPADLHRGFYDVLAEGKATLLARRTKNIQSFLKQKLEYRVYAKDEYFLLKNNSYTRLGNKRSLLKLLDDKKKELQQFTKQNKLSYKKNAEDWMLKVAAYYNEITR